MKITLSKDEKKLLLQKHFSDEEMLTAECLDMIVRSRNEIKGFCYINWDWANYPQWSNWGNAMIELNEEVLKRYREEMKNPAYIHYSEEMYEVLGYKIETESSEANEPE